MNIYELEKYFFELLSIDDFKSMDNSQNGLQVACSNKEIKKIAFAVDASLTTFEKAAKENCDAVFVHHGLFWSKPLTITGAHYGRIAKLLNNDIALYAAHLPLDAHPVYGNNAGLCKRLDLQNIEKFGWYKGKQIGFKGSLKESLTLDAIISKLFPDGKKAKEVLPFGKDVIKHIGIISGGAGFDVSQAISENLDCFITGEIYHEIYHTALENKISVIAGGHYETETIGVKLLCEKLHKDTNIETVFLDIPTNL